MTAGTDGPKKPPLVSHEGLPPIIGGPEALSLERLRRNFWLIPSGPNLHRPGYTRFQRRAPTSGSRNWPQSAKPVLPHVVFALPLAQWTFTSRRGEPRMISDNPALSRRFPGFGDARVAKPRAARELGPHPTRGFQGHAPAEPIDTQGPSLLPPHIAVPSPLWLVRSAIRT